MKKYFTPELKVINLKPQALLAGSDPEVTGGGFGEGNADPETDVL